jgi:hypothetical protein
MEGLNSKGLLKANPDGSIIGPKKSYHAYQYTATVFSEEITINKKALIGKNDQSLMVFAYDKKDKKGTALTVLYGAEKPEDAMDTRAVDFTVSGIQLKNPVFVDLLDGMVYDLPKEAYSKNGGEYIFSHIPVGDWPVLIVERDWIDVVSD